jgi:hypothetical protein
MNYRDVVYQGDIDKGAEVLAQCLQFSSELKQAVETYCS